ncbi:hypothetical protein XENOCAPTIV_010920 [Xenoophorus captivus]|uniref:Uncharacterized protein n=1 Tax=Xenoophorus captivus TaxID=1517983 RepID=A0ABV0RC30_9TELE
MKTVIIVVAHVENSLILFKPNRIEPSYSTSSLSSSSPSMRGGKIRTKITPSESKMKCFYLQERLPEEFSVQCKMLCFPLPQTSMYFYWDFVVVAKRKLLLKENHKTSHLQFATRYVVKRANMFKMALWSDKIEIILSGSCISLNTSASQ